MSTDGAVSARQPTRRNTRLDSRRASVPETSSRQPLVSPEEQPLARRRNSDPSGPLLRLPSADQRGASGGSAPSRSPNRHGTRLSSRGASPNPQRADGRKNSRTRTIVSPEPQQEPSPPVFRRSKSARILDCFKLFDRNGDGKINRNELAAVLKALDRNCSFDEEGMQGLIDEVDTSCDGSIDYEEFTAWLTGEPVLKSQKLREHCEDMVQDGAPEERLENAIKAMEASKEAAVPPKPIEASIAESELWIFTKKGESLDNARRSTEPTTVCQIAPNSDAYRNGVRVGMRVVSVAGRSCSSNHNILEQMLKFMGGGGGATRSVLVHFMSEDALKQQEQAMETLRSHVEKVEAAKALVKTFEDVQVHDQEKATVSIKYYYNTVFFDVDDGRLEAARIDGAFNISDVMPGCDLFLAQGTGDNHMMRFAQEVTSKASRVETREGEGCDKAVFTNLVHTHSYDLVVVPNAARARNERESEWRRGMAIKAHEERMAGLPEHSCDKERVPVGIRVETGFGHFRVFIDNTEGSSLGMCTSADTGGTCLRVDDVLQLGLISIWNAMHPHQVVKHGDRITEINGVEGSDAALAKELRRKAPLDLKLQRVDFAMGDAVFGQTCKGQWEKACITADNRDGTYTLQWFDGREEDRIKGPFEMKKQYEEMEHVAHTRVDGDYWFCGSCHSRAMYKNNHGAVISFWHDWRINFCEESEKAYYCSFGATGVRPPPTSLEEGWQSPENPGRTASISYLPGQVCRVCALPTFLDMHSDS